jgi:hypothetical protein
MLPEHLCRRDVPGLDEAILVREYAEIERITENEVIDYIAGGRLNGARFQGAWYVEAPSFCEDRLTRLRAREQVPPKSESKTHQSTPPAAETIPDEIIHARVLGLRGRVTLADIKRHYRERMMEYHPDKVASLGHKLREVAEDETKRINAAYEFFRAKYS